MMIAFVSITFIIVNYTNEVHNLKSLMCYFYVEISIVIFENKKDLNWLLIYYLPYVSNT